MSFLGSLRARYKFILALISTSNRLFRIRTCGIAPVDSPIGANSILLTFITLVTVSRAVKIKLEKILFFRYQTVVNRKHSENKLTLFQ